jgi:hypothetical protein
MVRNSGRNPSPTGPRRPSVLKELPVPEDFLLDRTRYLVHLALDQLHGEPDTAVPAEMRVARAASILGRVLELMEAYRVEGSEHAGHGYSDVIARLRERAKEGRSDETGGRTD